MHFCTPRLLRHIKDPITNTFKTFRTGWIPNIYPGDIININERNDKKEDTFICQALVTSVSAIRYCAILDMHKSLNMFPGEEIARYNKKFHKDHWFLIITLKKKWKEKRKTMEDFVKG